MKFPDHENDLLVIGGGINGAAVALMAAGMGKKVALVEKGDFASGTSSKSTKLIHGGLRYLENLDFGLVKEALKERFIQLKNVAHLVNPLQFIIPVYRDDPRPLWLVKCGVWLYDFLSGPYAIQKHRVLSADEVASYLPGIKRDGLVGGVMYLDAQMDDARLCLENILSAREKGAKVANYTEVVSLLKEKGRCVGVEAMDVATKEKSVLRAKQVVCSVGPWSNRLKQLDCPGAPDQLRTTKGVHVVYRERISDRAMLLQVKADRRIFFVIPWMGHSLIGTTDTDYQGDLDQVRVEQEDVDYLFQELRRVFPNNNFTKENILCTFAGLRPLVFDHGDPSRLSRQHVIEKSPSGIVYILGGKYTTYRSIAWQCLRKLGYPVIDQGVDYPLYGSGPLKEVPELLAARYDIDVETVFHLRNKYGIRYRAVLELVAADPQGKELICPFAPDIRAQIVYAIKMEMARTTEDIYWRRLGLGYRGCDLGECRRIIEPYLVKYKEGVS